MYSHLTIQRMTKEMAFVRSPMRKIAGRATARDATGELPAKAAGILSNSLSECIRGE